jgi:hypothetical protein
MMTDPKSRNYLRVALGLFLLAIFAGIIVSAIQYWTDKRDPVGLTDDAR